MCLFFSGLMLTQIQAHDYLCVRYGWHPGSYPTDHISGKYISYTVASVIVGYLSLLFPNFYTKLFINREELLPMLILTYSMHSEPFEIIFVP